MKVKSVMDKVTGNKDVIVKRTLIIAGTVVGIALTAGLIVKNKNSLANVLEPVAEAVKK